MPNISHGPLTWVRGDLHAHCEDFELLDRLLDSIDGRLDFFALTNHSQKPVFFRQHEMVEILRRRWTAGPLFFGMEWNAPLGGHACVVFPPSADEAERAYELSRGFDRHLEGSSGDVAAALRSVDRPSVEERPVLCFNHPSPGQWSQEAIAEYRSRDPGGVICGVESVHGHQGYEAGARWDLSSYPSCKPGGLADAVYLEGQPFAMLAHSDFHVHKQDRQFDYAPGVFNQTLVGVPENDRSPESIFAGLRAGRTCAAQGHWFELVDFRVSGDGRGDGRLGDTWDGGDAVAVVEFESTEAVRRLDLIGSLDGGAVAVVGEFGPLSEGRHRVELPVPAGASGFLRLRAISHSLERPPPGPTAPKGFFSSAILLRN